MHRLRGQLLQSAVRVRAVAPGTVLNELWATADPREVQRRATSGEGLRSEDVAEAILFMLTRPRNIVIRDLVKGLSHKADNKLVASRSIRASCSEDETRMPALKSACEEENTTRAPRAKLKESVAQPATKKAIR